MRETTIWGTDAVCHSSPGFTPSPTPRPPVPTEETKSHEAFLTFHHILLVVTVVVTVRGPVIDVEAMDGGVVVTCWDVLRERRRNTLTVEQRDHQVRPWGTGISSGLEFKIYWGTLADISDDIPKALWRMLYSAQRSPSLWRQETNGHFPKELSPL